MICLNSRWRYKTKAASGELYLVISFWRNPDSPIMEKGGGYNRARLELYRTAKKQLSDLPPMS